MRNRNAKKMLKTLGIAAILAAMIPLGAYASAFAVTPEQAALGANWEHPKWQKTSFPLKSALKILGMDKESFWKEAKKGKSLADMAKEKGISRQELIDALNNDFHQKMDKAVREGKLTREQAEEKKKKIAKKIEHFVDNKHWKRDHYKSGHGKWGFHLQPALELLGEWVRNPSGSR